MRGGQRRQPLDVPLDGRVRQHCVFARMPGVFEPCTRLDHLGWLRYLAPLKPRFLVASDRSQVARRRVRLDLGDLGIIEQQLNQSSNQLGSQAFCPVVMHSPVTGLFRVLLDRFLLLPSVPASKSNVRLGKRNRLHSALQCME